jgi:hypothetical protein
LAPPELPKKAPAKKKIRWSAAWQEARQLIWARRWRLALGLVLMVISRLAGLVLPWLSKYLVDQVVGGPKRIDMLPTLAWLAVGTTVVQAVTSYGLSQILGVAAQKAITDMRRRVEEHVMRLPVRYFDKTQSGILIARVMNDAEGIRNLVGTGLVQLVGSIFTAVLALGHPVLPELVHDGRYDRRPRHVWRRDELCVPGSPAPVPRARADHGRSDGAVEPVARRRARGQDLHGRTARGPGLHQGRASARSATSPSR